MITIRALLESEGYEVATVDGRPPGTYAIRRPPDRRVRVAALSDDLVERYLARLARHSDDLPFDQRDPRQAATNYLLFQIDTATSVEPLRVTQFGLRVVGERVEWFEVKEREPADWDLPEGVPLHWTIHGGDPAA